MNTALRDVDPLGFKDRFNILALLYALKVLLRFSKRVVFVQRTFNKGCKRR